MLMKLFRQSNKLQFRLLVRNFTAEKRNSKYSILNEKDLNFFEKIVGSTHLSTDPTTLATFNTDWMRASTGKSKLVLFPQQTQQVSAILKYCNERKLSICTQGGNTGLVGGSVPLYDEIIISTKLMNKITSLDKESNILRCESGCILQNLNDYLEKEANLMMPLDLGAKGSCHIGGNVSTNAGGLRLLRYGSLKGNVLGLEVVLADGTIYNSMETALRKDNTGYDLNQLFIGAEGIQFKKF
jgi:FAD/FMN-containing dehydrogenase